jgi:hypothetical protein
MTRARNIGKMAAILVVGIAGVVASACSHHDDAAPSTPISTLEDPATCSSCHAQHFKEWSGSMHAYAAEDPIFLAMQKRAQRETNGQLGTFCAQCHAPMAVRDGATTDGSNLADLPAGQRGITCYFCHSVSATTDTHNNALTLAGDGVMRADIADPAKNNVHASAYSPLHDGDQIGASALCGTCHDVTTPAGVQLESSFAEWKQSLFSHDVPGQKLTCQGCHMPGSDGVAASNGPPRRIHSHEMPAVDLATTSFADTDNQKMLVQQNLDPSLVAKMCVRPPSQGDTVEITLDNAFVGHDFPSGAAHDRRVWVELIGYQGQSVVYKSGVVADGTPVSDTTDPDIWLFGEKLKDKDGKPTPFMWLAASSELTALPFAVTNDPSDPAYFHAKIKTYNVPPTADRITMRVRMIPFGVEILQALVQSGDLDPSVVSKVPTFNLGGTTLEWTKAKGYACVP